MIGEIAAVAAPLVIDAMSAKAAAKGQGAANREQMEFNHNEAIAQRDWEEGMFRKRYQYTRQDLEAAGYNPLMALGLNPSTPSSAAAQASPQSTTKEASAIMSKSAKDASQVGLNAIAARHGMAQAVSAQSAARIDKQEADIATSPWGKKLAAFDYGMRKSHVGGGIKNVMSAFGASRIAKSISDRIPKSSSSGKVRAQSSYDAKGDYSGHREYNYYD